MTKTLRGIQSGSPMVVEYRVNRRSFCIIGRDMIQQAHTHYYSTTTFLRECRCNIHDRSSKFVLGREYMSKEYVVVHGIYNYGIESVSLRQHSLT